MQLIVETQDEKIIQMIIEMIRPFNGTFHEIKKNVPNKIVSKSLPKRARKLGIMPNLVTYMASDFNAPLDDFATYMS
jgi:hypothetical protein